MITERSIAQVARQILQGVQVAHPDVQMYQDGGGLAPDLAIVILSPSGQATPVRLGDGGFSPLGAPGGGFGGVVVDMPLLTKGALPAQAATTYAVDKMLDVRGAFLTLIIVDSTLDQAVTIQAIGTISDSPGDANGRVNLGGAQALAAGNTTMQRLGLAIVRRDYPYPFLGVTYLTGAAPPTAGLIAVQGYTEKWPLQGVGF